MNQTIIESTLFECERIVERERLSSNEGYYYYSWALMTLRRYIISGRASVKWLKRFVNASPEKLMKIASQNSGSDEECLLAINKYLKKEKVDDNEF